jgi:hypothetical protein
MQCNLSFSISWNSVPFSQRRERGGTVSWARGSLTTAPSLPSDSPSDAGRQSSKKKPLCSLSCASQVKPKMIHYQCDRIPNMFNRISKLSEKNNIGREIQVYLVIMYWAYSSGVKYLCKNTLKYYFKVLLLFFGVCVLY